MDCKEVKERLIDYIDGELNNDEELAINKHLNTCIECKKDYEELKSTMDYIIDNSNKIDTTRDIKLTTDIVRSKPIRRITRTGLIAIALSFIMIVTAFATDMFGIIEGWKRYSAKPLNAWEELLENGVGQKLDISVVDQNIRVTAEGVISDEINTIILLKIEDLNEKTRFIPPWDYLKEPRSFILSGDIPNVEGLPADIPPFSSFAPLYLEDENIIKLMVWTNPLDKDEGDIHIHINKFISMINKDLESMVEVQGNWDLSIPVKHIKSKVFSVNKTINLGGNELLIKDIVVAPTMTKINYSIHNKDNEHKVEHVTFQIKSRLKTYDSSELNHEHHIHYDGSWIHSDYNIQSIYLEAPEEIELIINSYDYKDKGYSLFDIDWDNLPQTIKYKESKITIESIEYNDDNTKITIREDSNKSREYISSNIYLEIDEKRYGDDNGHKYSYIRKNPFYASDIENEVRDSKGKKIDLDDRLWIDEYYRYVFKQELILSKEEFRSRQMDEEKFEEYLKPGTLYIGGQNYKKFPNTKIKISLK